MSNINLEPQYTALVRCFEQWLADTCYENHEIPEMTGLLEEFFIYLQKDVNNLKAVNNEYLHNYYQDKLFEAGLHKVLEENLSALVCYNRHQATLKEFGRFLRSISTKKKNKGAG